MVQDGCRDAHACQATQERRNPGGRAEEATEQSKVQDYKSEVVRRVAEVTRHPVLYVTTILLDCDPPIPLLPSP